MRLDVPVEARFRSAVDWFLRSRRTGRRTVVQAPNVPLGVWLAATVVRLALHPGGAAGTAVDVVATVSLVVWAADEVLRGVNPFRRLLGATVLVGLAASRLLTS